MLRLQGIKKRFGSQAVLRGLDLEIGRGQALRINGPNGSGKSTLLSIAAGFGIADRGEVACQQPVSYVGHQPGLYLELTAARNLTCFALDFDIVHLWVEKLELASHMSKPVQHLSRGTQQKVALVMQIASRAPLWISDEPFNALDMETVEKITDAYLQHLSAGGALMWVSHGSRPRLDSASAHVELAA